jgi:hypothetical protein
MLREMCRRQKHKKLLLITAFVFTHQGILNQTTFVNLIAVDVYVAYRSQSPDEETVNLVKKELKENNIKYSRLADYPTNKCK